MLGFSDAELGGALAQHWTFPEPLVDAVTNHALRTDRLPDPNSRTAAVIRARLLACAHGLSDGLERGGHAGQSEEWTVPPISMALSQSGGIDGVLERVDAFLEPALP